MQDWLVPIFGVWGAVVVQFVLTAAIVLGLISIAWWLVRQYSGVRIGGIGRGRVPRLAVVEAAHVDRRRKLVLVRRDNVEHLLLIGGPADLVVEPGINRQRMRAAQQAGQAAGAPATQAAPMSAEAAPAEIAPAFTPRAPSPAPPPRPAAIRPAPVLPAAVIARGEGVDETEDHRAAQLALLMRSAAPLADDDQPTLPDIVPDEPPPITVPARAALPFFTPLPEEPPQPSLDLGETDAPATAADEPPQGTGGDAKVSDLEREMARLLGEITARRSS